MTTFDHRSRKSSGVAWLGDIPLHWGVGQSRRMFQQRKERIREGDIQLTASQKYGVISQRRFMEIEGQNVTQVLTGQDILKHVEAGDFVISMRSFQGGIELAQDSGCISSAYVVLAPGLNVFRPFFAYLLKSAPYIQALQSTSNLVRDGQALRFDNFTQVDLPIVSVNEQVAIAAFLDRETSKIDALVEEQKRLIDLLKEKRQVVISHAVTKGLNPDAPMKDSGIEWLGEVPEHWEVARLKHFVEFLDGRRIPLSAEERSHRQGDYPYYGASGVIDHIDDFLFDEDLILVGEDGANLINRSSPLSFIASGKYWVNNHAHILRPNDMQIRFWVERIETIDFVPFVTGSAQPKLTIDALANVPVAAPPSVDERELIAEHVSAVKGSFEPLINEAEKSIGLLRERRAALISAAVTGKIDVRSTAQTRDAAE